MAELPVPSALDGERLDRSLAVLTGRSRASVEALVAAGEVSVDGWEVTNRSRRVHTGEIIAVTLPEAPHSAAPRPDPSVPVPIVWEDSDLVVVDKPAGVVVHPGAGHPTGTLVEGLLARYPDIAGAGGEVTRPGIVHRLDKGTSGLLVVARTPEAHTALATQMRRRSARREYLALVQGEVSSESGVVDGPVRRSERDPTAMQVGAGGRPARTRYQVEGRYSDPSEVTLVRCELETGRTHQIRVHMASIGHPVVGDRRYGWRPRSGWQPLPPGRPFLHAAALELEHPRTGTRRRFTSPLPEDLAGVLAQLTPCSPAPGGTAR